MKGNAFDRRKRAKLALAVLIVGLTVSSLVGMLLYYIGRLAPHV